MVDDRTLEEHLRFVKSGERRFENAFQAVDRMIRGDGSSKYVQKVTVNGRETYDYLIFREGKKPLVGMHEVINSFVSFVKDAAEGGSSKEMAYVLVGEPGNGKTFFAEYLCKAYREFAGKPGNHRYSFRFNMDKLVKAGLKGYMGIDFIESQTFEDPMILAMNLGASDSETESFLGGFGFSEKEMEKMYRQYRPLGACTDYVLGQVRELTNGNVQDMLKFIDIIPIQMSETMGTLTGKYPAKDKMTSSAADLVGKESIQRILKIADTNNPYVIDLRKGALARVAGGGIHFSDEIFKNKLDLVQVYLGVIQNRFIEINGHKWPIDTLIVATSNIAEFNNFASDHGQAPVVDRCRISYMPHNTNYKFQMKLTEYTLGRDMTTLSGEKLHSDPNLIRVVSKLVTLTRQPVSDKLSRTDMQKLLANEVAGNRSMKELQEIVDIYNRNPDVSKRFGHQGLGQRSIGRAFQRMRESASTNEGKCLCAADIFEAYEREILDTVTDAKEREKCLEDLMVEKQEYKKDLRSEIFNAYMDDANAIKKDVLSYVNMIIGTDATSIGADKVWTYRDFVTNQLVSLKIDEKFIDAVEARLGLKTKEQVKEYRDLIRTTYSQKVSSEPGYSFTDNARLVEAVTDVRLESDINGVGSLIGALGDPTKEENRVLKDRMLNAMKKQGYCKTCATKTLEEFCNCK